MNMIKANKTRTLLLLAIDQEITAAFASNNHSVFSLNSSSSYDASVEIIIKSIMINSSSQLDTFVNSKTVNNTAGFFFHKRSETVNDEGYVAFVNQLDDKKQLVSEKIRKNSIFKEKTVKFKEEPQRKQNDTLIAFKVLRKLSNSYKKTKPSLSLNKSKKKIIKSRRGSVMIDTKEKLAILEEEPTIIKKDSLKENKPRRKHTAKNNNIYVTSDMKQFQAITTTSVVCEASGSPKKRQQGNSMRKDEKKKSDKILPMGIGAMASSNRTINRFSLPFTKMPEDKTMYML